jgi:hypothetical protein
MDTERGATTELKGLKEMVEIEEKSVMKMSAEKAARVAAEVAEMESDRLNMAVEEAEEAKEEAEGAKKEVEKAVEAVKKAMEVVEEKKRHARKALAILEISMGNNRTYAEAVKIMNMEMDYVVQLANEAREAAARAAAARAAAKERQAEGKAAAEQAERLAAEAAARVNTMTNTEDTNAARKEVKAVRKEVKTALKSSKKRLAAVIDLQMNAKKLFSWILDKAKAREEAKARETADDLLTA